MRRDTHSARFGQQHVDRDFARGEVDLVLADERMAIGALCPIDRLATAFLSDAHLESRS
jgi:hypothetical protein